MHILKNPLFKGENSISAVSSLVQTQIDEINDKNESDNRINIILIGNTNIAHM